MSLETMNNLAYDIWEPGINDELENEQGSMYAWLNKSSKQVYGRRTKMKFLIGRSLGINNIPEAGDFPIAGDPVHDEVEITLNRLAATTEFTLEEIDLLNGRDAGALPVVQHKLDDLVRTLRRDVIRQTWGDGSATLARAAGTVTKVDATTITFVLSADETVQYDRDRYLWLEENGMLVDFATPLDMTGATTNVQDYGPGAFPDSATYTAEYGLHNSTPGLYSAVKPAAARIVGIDRATDTVTAKVADADEFLALAVAAGDHIVRRGNVQSSVHSPNWPLWLRDPRLAGTPAVAGGDFASMEFPGIQAAIDVDNVYMGKDRTAPEVGYWWKANVQSAGDGTGALGPLTIDKILQLVNAMNTRTGRSPLTKEHGFFSNLGVWSSYGEQVEPRVRYQGYQKIDRGWPELEIFGMPFYADIHCPHNTLFLIHRPTLEYRVPKYADRGTFQFQNLDGSMWRYAPGIQAENPTYSGYRAKIQSHLTGMMTLICQHPRMQGKLTDIEEVGVPTTTSTVKFTPTNVPVDHAASAYSDVYPPASSTP